MNSNIEWALPLPTTKVFSTNFLAVPTPPKFSPTKVLCYTVHTNIKIYIWWEHWQDKHWQIGLFGKEKISNWPSNITQIFKIQKREITLAICQQFAYDFCYVIVMYIMTHVTMDEWTVYDECTIALLGKMHSGISKIHYNVHVQL